MHLSRGEIIDQRGILRQLAELQYTRNDIDFRRGTYRVRGDVIDIFPAESDELAIRLELFDEGDHVVDPPGGVRLLEHGTGVEHDHVAVETGRLTRGELEEVDTELTGLREDRVVDVGDVAHVRHRVAEVFESTDEQVVGQVGVGVTEMGGVVRRDAADVHLHLGSRFERDDLPAGRVEELHVGHGSHLR